MTDSENRKTVASLPVLVAMSGGVDSSLAAVLLREAGREVVGVNMRTHRLTPEEKALGAAIKTCCSPVDAKDARACADRGDFPFYVLDVEPSFERDVIDPFIRAYMGGRTPNPCVLCNNHVKLGLLLEKARLWGCGSVATGHYARKVRHPETGRWTLARAADTRKDQCYYLYGLTQEQLAAIEFPLGELTKEQVRERARAASLPTADKPESQEICFIPDNDYRGFLRRRFAERGVAMPRGRFVTTSGEVLGEHEGIAFYTVGQRRGLGIAGGEPLYVVAIDAATHSVVVGPREAVLAEGLEADGLNWMGLEELTAPRRARVQVRHRHEPAWGRLEPLGPDRVRVTFETPVQAVSPGQAVVFWDEANRVLGGGWIACSLSGVVPTAPA
ncbi:MAG: tRNA 2-thiouridine(34) synthase MnmA [Candidatus Sumerlaeia bacterium]|nr:tRNA 2-thiouridine(34) synthase MnmA [Candidatus Sumerlaeia bacterium]